MCTSTGGGHWEEESLAENVIELKGVVLNSLHKNKIIYSSFTHRHVVLDLYAVIFSIDYKRRVFMQGFDIQYNSS